LQAQLVNYVQYRALLESWNARMWKRYTGMLIWKTQNPWPGLRGQLYDCQLDQTAGFFGVKAACEPVHVQLNLVTRNVEVGYLNLASLAFLSLVNGRKIADGGIHVEGLASLD
jgi:mannosylglycoprotein endo-beta-mannosidase